MQVVNYRSSPSLQQWVDSTDPFFMDFARWALPESMSSKLTDLTKISKFGTNVFVFL